MNSASGASVQNAQSMIKYFAESDSRDKPIFLTERGYILMANNRALDLIGVGADGIIGHHCFEFISDKWIEAIFKRILLQASGLFSFILHRPDGNEYALDVCNYPVAEVDSNLMITVVNHWHII